MFGDKAIEGLATSITKIVAKEIVGPITQVIITEFSKNLSNKDLIKEFKELNKTLKELVTTIGLK